MPYAARELTASILPNGFIHIAGGFGAGMLSLSYWYDPFNNTWIAKSNLPVPWVDGRVGALPDGRTIIHGGSTTVLSPRSSTAYIYDPATDTYTLAPSLLVATGNHVGATLSDGRILAVAGVSGDDSPNVLETQIFDPETLTWSLGANHSVGHGNYCGIAATPCGTVYLWGGAGPSRAGTKMVSAYNPSTDTWSILEDLPFFAGWGAYGRFYDGQYIWASGHNNTSMTAKTYLSATPIVE